jgi:hypothetical protein
VRVFVAALALLLILPACGAQTSEHGAAAPAPDGLSARLDTVVVPVEDVGGLPIDQPRVAPGSGWVGNGLEARTSYDPEDSAGSLARAGRVTGYELTYYDPTETALRSGNGLHSFKTAAELFSSEQAASAALRRRIDFARGLENRSPLPDVRFGPVQPFAVEAADEAYGLREAVRFGRDEVYRTFVGFRRGRVVGEVMVVRADRADGKHLARQLVGLLDTRIQIALHGGSNGEPVEVPAYAARPGGGEPAAPARPAGAPDLAAIALGAGDLPPGITCNPGEYTRTTGPRFMFERSFCTHGKAVGRTPLLALANQVGVFESKVAAQASVSISARAAESPDAVERFRAGFDSTHSVLATNINSRRVELGHGAVVVLYTFDTKLGSVVYVDALAHAGRGVTTIEALAPAKDFHAGDIARLLRIVQARLAAAD